MLTEPSELIGEEIYDEFDPEGAGHGAPSSYIPPKSPVHSLSQRASAPDLKRAAEDDVAPLRLSVPAPVAPTRSASGSITPILRPLKNLNFLTSRSRSAPPVPRDGPPSAAPVISDVKEDEEGSEKPPEPDAPTSKRDFAFAEEKEDTQPIGDLTPEVIVSMPPPEDAAQAPPISPVPRRAAVQSHSAANSRAGSPAPLEALILDRSRSRRPAAALAGTLTPRSATPSRGARFKSGPLGVVVAEQVRMNSGTGKPSRAEAVERMPGDEKAGENIPDSKDKEGPDKPSEV
jgi:metal transporter CNNM